MQTLSMSGNETRQETRTMMLRYAVPPHTSYRSARLQQAWTVTIYKDGMPSHQEIEWRDVETVVVDDKR
jgi:hypothetical protein